MTKIYTGRVADWDLPDGTKLHCIMASTRVFTEGDVYEIDGEYISDNLSTDWITCDFVSSKFEVFEPNSIKGPKGPSGAVKSDGGSSSYYELNVNGIDLETQDIIHGVFGNDFDFGNMFKAQVRIWAALQGGGKAGTSIEYDLNKIIYTCEKLKQRHVKTT